MVHTLVCFVQITSIDPVSPGQIRSVLLSAFPKTFQKVLIHEVVE